MAVFSSGLLAGAFTYGFFSVVPTFSEVPLQVHLTYRDALMKHNGIYMQIAMAASILAPSWWAFTMHRSVSSRRLALAGSALAIISFLVTRFGNVPINRLIRTWSAASPPADYQHLLQRWLLFNHIRTASALGAFLCVIAATTLCKEH